jgi:hypothetical protein
MDQTGQNVGTDDDGKEDMRLRISPNFPRPSLDPNLDRILRAKGRIVGKAVA